MKKQEAFTSGKGTSFEDCINEVVNNRYQVACFNDLIKASERVIQELVALQSVLNDPDQFHVVEDHSKSKAWAFVENNTAIRRLCEMITRSNLYLRS